MEKQKSLGAGLVGLLLSIGVVFFSSFVLMKVYNWFIPNITGWGEITYWMAMGIDVVLSVVNVGLGLSLSRIKDNTVDTDDYDDIAESIIKVIIYAILLGIGALVQLGI